ncbi:hypothetical protein CH267_13470 [Rhodococcus sp. 06-621-2]|nr:hypothetical protein CH267_13470 [Rhodococcus sp. 06-621-2]
MSSAVHHGDRVVSVDQFINKFQLGTAVDIDREDASDLPVLIRRDPPLAYEPLFLHRIIRS